MKTFSAVICGAICLLFLGVSESSAASCSANPTNVVVNCGFETGTFAGWTLTGNDVPSELNNLYGVEGADPIDGITPHSGSYQAFIADLSSNATKLSQTVNTQAGYAYVISFDLANDTQGTIAYPNTISVMFDGVSLYSMTNVPVEGYTQYSFSGSAVAATTGLSITLGNSLGEFLLDDVSVSIVPIPEPATWPLAAAALLAVVVLGRKKLAA